ncbi:MAG: DUF4019 domain-containing protein [Phycisphaerae bacterium]|jgi:tetratricopeptide (TPR) repeat protein|nr:DUF4019 domain-containing protein [Phycisphaerae bacterium]
MKRRTFFLLAAMAMLAPQTARAESPALLLEKGVFAEETKGDIDAAIKIYKQILDDAQANRKYVARAYYRLGTCLLKKKQYIQAETIFRKLIADFPKDAKLVARAREQLRQARSRITGTELSKIVTQAVMTISTCAETDPRVKGALELLSGLNEPAVVKELTKHFASEKNTVRRSAIYILWKGDFSKITPAETGLTKLCKHKEGMTRGMAALTLGARKINSSLQVLCDMALKDQSPYARRCAAYALGLMGNPDARPVLEKALKDKNEFVSNNAEAAMTMLNAQARLPADVMGYMVDIHMGDYKKSQAKGQRVNSHIYGVDDQFNLHFGGLIAVKNETDKVINDEITVGNFGYTDFEVMNETGALQKIRFVDRKTATGGRYRLMWTPDKPLKSGQVRLLGWKKTTTRKLTKVTGDFQLTMKNHFGAQVLESFFLVLPPNVTITRKSTDYVSLKRVGSFDVYHWQRTVPVKTTNVVELVLKKGSGGPADPLVKLAWYLWNQRKLKESEKLFRQAVEKDPKSSDAWNGLGWALQNQGKSEAVRAFKKCLALDSKNAGALNGMGWIAKQEGREDHAIGWWQKAVMANPQTTAALRGLTTTFMARGQYHQAAVCYAAWVKVDPNNKKLKTEMDDALAKAKVALAESKKAVAAAEKWLALLDEGKYAESWDESAGFFRKSVARTKWAATMKDLRTPLGKVKSRTKQEADYRTSLPGAPDGEYVVIMFKTTFANKAGAIETVTPVKGKDGKWRVSGYYIK